MRSPRRRVRLWFLGVINGLILVHVLLYYVFNRQAVGCVDFFGLATFFGLGRVTAGTLFLVVLLLVTLLWGRIFCGWGCHFALFQDLFAGWLHRLGVRVPFRRSRTELILPPLIFAITILYPIAAWWRDRGFPSNLSVNLSYPDVWHLLPGLKGVLLLLLVDVLVLTVFLGGRAFCRYLCPYGLFLKFFQALSPMRIVKVGDCSNCGSCARSCPTGVPIKLEVEKFGVIHDLNCMNCGDCVSACPDGVLALKATRLAYSRGFSSALSASNGPLWIDVVLVLVVAVGFVAYRGHEYGDFLAAGMGLMCGSLIVVAIKPHWLASARRSQMFGEARIRRTAILIACYLFLGIVGQAIGLYSLSRARSLLLVGNYPAAMSSYGDGRWLAGVFRPFTFYLDDFDDRAKRWVVPLEEEADRLMTAARWSDAELVYRAVTAAEPSRIRAYGNLGAALLKQGRFWEAVPCYLRVLDYDPNDLIALYHLAIVRIQLGQKNMAVETVQRILSIDTVGNAYHLIEGNPLFRLLDEVPGYRRAMSMYRPQRSDGSLKAKEPLP